MTQQQLIITYDDSNGNVNVNGPINNKGICYLMIECARDAIKDANDRAQQAVTVPSNGDTLPSFIRKTIRRHKR